MERHTFRGIFLRLGNKITAATGTKTRESLAPHPLLRGRISIMWEIAARKQTAFAGQGWAAQHTFPPFECHIQTLQKIQSNTAL